MGMTSEATSSSFNPHTHTGCDEGSPAYPHRYVSFNPHTHTGCDGDLHLLHLSIAVSIHTPIQGVTAHPVAPPTKERVSIHTPIQGVTRHSTPFAAYPPSFNPHTHTGCDLNTRHIFGDDSVSIHTPIQGVTYCWACKRAPFLRFNPHTHTGCDLGYWFLC